MANVRDLFSKLFAYVLLFEQTNLPGHPQRSYEEVRRDITALLEQTQTEARQQRVSDSDYQDACFAVVAWVDETIQKSTWEHRNRWRASLLQDEYFNTKNAGAELFQRLKRLGSEKKEIHEIYYLSLGLGFSGQYFLEEDQPKLVRERLEQAQHLSMPVEDVRDIKKITPQPYEVPAPDNGLPKPPWTRLLLKIGVALLVVIPLALFLVYKIFT